MTTLDNQIILEAIAASNAVIKGNYFTLAKTHVVIGYWDGAWHMKWGISPADVTVESFLTDIELADRIKELARLLS